MDDALKKKRAGYDRRLRPPQTGGPRALQRGGRDHLRQPPAKGEAAKHPPTDRQPPQADDPAAEQALVYGKNAVAELLKSGAVVDTLFLAQSLPRPVAAYYTALAKSAGAVVKQVHAAKLQALTGVDSHQGVACSAALIPYVQPQQMLQNAAEKGEAPLLVLADGVEDPHNLGAILRTALLCGAHGLIIPQRGGVGITPAVLKASAGAAALLPVARVVNMGQTIRWLKEQNIFVYCAQMGGDAPHSQNLCGPLALVLGGEGDGVSPLVQRLCDGVLSLPMAPHCGGVDSFNVSVAAGMLLYEINLQRAQGPHADTPKVN